MPNEIERKWLVECFPQSLEGFNLIEHTFDRQAYIFVSDEAESRIRSSCFYGTQHLPIPWGVRCWFAVKTGNGLIRPEYEVSISVDDFNRFSSTIDKPFITKEYRSYRSLDNQILLEVSHVDPGLDTSFLYAEVEFSDSDVAEKFILPDIGMGKVVEVTDNPEFSMKNYWRRTRD